MSGPFEAFGLRCARGEQMRARVKVGELNSGAEVSIPVRLAHGGGDGPVVGLNAMVHGDEVNGYAVVNRIFDELDPASLRGTIIGIPVANPFALHANARISPFEYERLNLNRVFPGFDGGFQMERLAELIFREGVRRSDAWIDLHEGGRDFIARYLIVQADGTPAPRDLELARWFGQGVPVELYTISEEHRRVGRAGASTVQASDLGRRALGVELGGGGVLRPDFVDTGVVGTRRVLRGLGALAGGPPEPDPRPQAVVRQTSWPRPTRGGFWEQDVALGAVVEAQQVIGRVRDLFGAVIEELRAPYRCVIFDVRHTATIQTGEWTVKCGRLA